MKMPAAVVRPCASCKFTIQAEPYTVYDGLRDVVQTEGWSQLLQAAWPSLAELRRSVLARAWEKFK